MNICYLCGEEMIERPPDYSSNSKKYMQCAIKHDEHIIQNSLYGRLTNENILCEKCGGKLASDIDSDFCKIFDGITEQIKHILAPKDHGSKKSNKRLNGYIFRNNGEVIEVFISEGKATPKNPFHEYIEVDNRVRVFTTQEIAQNYTQKVKIELMNKGIDVGCLQFEVIDDISYMGTVGVNFSEGIDNFNSKLKLGLSKIATGFAISNGIERSQLPCTLDITNKKIIFDENVVPFFPKSVIDCLIEPLRVVHEEGYPTHTLILFTDDLLPSKKLICYIDLFSTFQFYVILNHDYEGENFQNSYYQTILKQERPNINIRGIRYKYLGLLASELNVSTDYFKGKTIDEIYDYLEIKHKQMTVCYKLDLQKYISDISDKAVINTFAMAHGITTHLSELEKEILGEIPHNLNAEDWLALQIEKKNGISYRQKYIKICEGNPCFVSPCYQSVVTNNLNPDRVRKYTFSKFHHLTRFICENNWKV